MFIKTILRGKQCVGRAIGAEPGSQPVRRGAILALALSAALIAVKGEMISAAYAESVDLPPDFSSRFPTVAADHPYALALLDNAMRYLAPESGTVDAASGYPVEGWNNDPEQGLALRSFTQLTAIGEWIEALANVVAGHADTPYLSRQQALDNLSRAVRSLRHDQQDPQVGAKGLLTNFLDLGTAKRFGPLASKVSRQSFIEAFGEAQGVQVWKALAEKGWIAPESNGRQAAILRQTNYGAAWFDGPLARYDDGPTKDRIMAILDQRVVTVVFGDNANLSSSVARAIGALLAEAIRDDPVVVDLRAEMDRFLDAQQEGYADLYNSATGLFYFGWDATLDRPLGWLDGEGNWRAGHMDYLINEFRGPATFVVLRYGLPSDAVANLGFTMKPYRDRQKRTLYVLAPWEGSSFQALGLALCPVEVGSRSWQTLLEGFVDVELDYARRHRLPGFLSESYTGQGAHYTGDVGIPDIAVTTMPRLTNIASLYTLGVAYSIAPGKVERFLAENWSTISQLLTDHGPWEGFNVATQQPIRVQTTAHTLSLILGLLGTGPQQMNRYLGCQGLLPRLQELRPAGELVDFLSEENRCFAWGDRPAAVTSVRQADGFRIEARQANRVAAALVSPREDGVALSDGLLTIGYRSAHPLAPAVITLKPANPVPPGSPILPKQLHVDWAQTFGQHEELQISLPATPGLAAIKEIVIETGPAETGGVVDLTITRFAFAPYGGSLDDAIRQTARRSPGASLARP